MEKLFSLYSIHYKLFFLSASIVPFSIFHMKKPSFCKNIPLSQADLNQNLISNKNLSFIQSSMDKACKHANSYKESHKVNFQQLLNVNIIKNFLLDNKAKQIRKEIKTIRQRFRDYLNYISNNLYDDKGRKKEIFNDEVLKSIDYDQIIRLILQFNEMKREISSVIDNFFIQEYLFFETEEIILRLLNVLLIVDQKYDKNFPVLSQENINKIIEICREVFFNPIECESKRLFAQRIMINLLTKDKDYFYDDSLVEINLKEGEKNEREYDLVFLQGLNASFSKGWRIDDHKLLYTGDENYKLYFKFLLKGTHAEKLYSTEKYTTWIPIMLKDNEFKEFNIRYIFSSYETYVLMSNYRHHNIPHKDLNEIARSLYFAMKHAKVGEKPFVLVCHSMGGLIGKTILNLAKENHDEKYLENAKGVVFFSTPHFGSDVVLRILDSLVVNYQNIFKIFQTTANEYGFNKEDILHNLEKIELSKPTMAICRSPQNYFYNLHQRFKELKIPYVCFIESNQSYIKHINNYLYIVRPESAILPETHNYFGADKIHSNIQKFHPSNYNDPIFINFCNFLKEKLNLKK